MGSLFRSVGKGPVEGVAGLPVPGIPALTVEGEGHVSRSGDGHDELGISGVWHQGRIVEDVGLAGRNCWTKGVVSDDQARFGHVEGLAASPFVHGGWVVDEDLVHEEIHQETTTAITIRARAKAMPRRDQRAERGFTGIRWKYIILMGHWRLIPQEYFCFIAFTLSGRAAGDIGGP